MIKFAFSFNMEKSFKIWQNFVIGLLVGIIAGGSIVWLEMKDANRNFLSQILYELNTLKLEKKIAEDEYQKEKAAETKNLTPAGRHAKQIKTGETPGIITPSDSSNIVILKNDSTLPLPITATLDSLQIDSSISSQDIVIRKDRLIFSTSLKLKIKDAAEDNATAKDSMMGEMSGVHMEDEKKEYIVEFWESPINYKGYKMGNKKIILFGIGEEFENVSLLQVDKKIYLKYYDMVYQLDVTYNFEPLKKITDKTLLAKIE